MVLSEAALGYPVQRDDLLTLNDGGLFVVVPPGQSGRSTKKSSMYKENLPLRVGTFCIGPRVMDELSETDKALGTKEILDSISESHDPHADAERSKTRRRRLVRHGSLIEGNHGGVSLTK